VPKRLFIGLELPRSSRMMLAELDPHVQGVRWVPVEQFHLTMSFLGQVEAGQEERLRAALAGVRVSPFFLPIQGVGVFGGEHPTTVWAGVGKGHPHLFALHKHIQDSILQSGLEPDLRPFHPHITLGRAKDVPRQALRPFLRRHEKTEFDLWQVTGFELFSSVLSPGGATYTVGPTIDGGHSLGLQLKEAPQKEQTRFLTFPNSQCGHVVESCEAFQRGCPQEGT
jgi:2'-5' RNA ligase